MGEKSAPQKTPVDPEVLAAYEQSLAALRERRTPFALIGGLALEAYGARRRTTDVDFLVFAAPRAWSRIAGAITLGVFEELQYVVVQAERTPSG